MGKGLNYSEGEKSNKHRYSEARSAALQSITEPGSYSALLIRLCSAGWPGGVERTGRERGEWEGGLAKTLLEMMWL